MRLFTLVAVACLVVPGGAKAEGSTLYERWRTVKSSFMGGELLLKCGNELKIRRSWMGKIEVHFLDSSMNWKPLEVSSLSDGGLEFEGLSYRPNGDMNVLRIAKEVIKREHNIELEPVQSIRAEPAEDKIEPTIIKINFVSGLYEVSFKNYITYLVKWHKKGQYLHSGTMPNDLEIAKYAFKSDKTIFDDRCIAK